MSHVLTLATLSAATPDGRLLFSDLSLSVGVECVGLVGRNGSGKSTLLDIVEGRATPVAGTVHRAGSVGRLAQHWPNDQVIAHALGVADALATLARIEAGAGTANDFDTADWALSAVVEAALDDVGLRGVDLDAAMGTLSGGERTRIGIARLLIDRPDLLLLDEPTNNLDRAGRDAIQRLVARWRGGVLVASHDRVLLEAVDRIVELNPVGIRIVGGGWTEFVAIRDAERTQAEAQRDRADATLRRTRHAAQAAQEVKDRRDKAGRAFAAKGSEPRILLGARAERSENSGGSARRLAERQISEASTASETARAQIEVLTPLTIDLPATGLPSQTEVLALQEATVDLGGRRFGPWTFAMRGPERLAIAGPNGAGKSTLLRLAIGDFEPSGGAVRHRRERMAMLDQHVGLLDPADTIVGNMRRLHPMLDEEAVHAACARFAFRNRDAQRIVGSLSGGERLRAGLAAAMSGPQPPWLLLLDEPTNHLDLDSIGVLERALCSFDGALLVVSHDTRFLDVIGVSQKMNVGADTDGSVRPR